MAAEGIFFAGTRGFHLLFDSDTICAAFERDPGELRDLAIERRDEVEDALVRVLELDQPEAAREIIDGMPPEVRHVLVLLYFELLDGRVGERRILH